MKKISSLSAIVLILGVVGCTWVELSPQGEGVSVVTANEVTSCKRIGQTTVHSRAKVAGLERHGDKVQSELNTLARNSAPEISGDTVVAVGKPDEGKQVFEVYRCKP